MAANGNGKYRPAFAEQARKLCELGAIDQDLAGFFNTSRATIVRWRVAYPEFAAALRVGKASADERVVSSLYQRAIGYSHDTVHVSNYQGKVTLTPITEKFAPDTTAAIFWLKNRRPEEWRDIRAVEHSGTVTNRHVTALSDEELTDIAAGRGTGTAATESGSGKRSGVH